MSMIGNMKIARSERSYYCYIHMPTFRIIWLLRNLSLGGKLCLRDRLVLKCGLAHLNANTRDESNASANAQLLNQMQMQMRRS